MAAAVQKWLVVGAIVLGMGAHWVLLQSVAWTGMVISYSQHSSIREALRMTFDGEHPCCLCKAVKAVRQAERERHQQKLLLKLDPFVQESAVPTLYPPALAKLSLRPQTVDLRASEAPPTPPPILT